MPLETPFETSFEAPSKHTDKGNILIVDDEAVVTDSLSRWLAEDRYTVGTASSAAEALRRFQGRSWDLILIDIKMPGMDGLELLRRLHEIDPTVVLVIMTGYVVLVVQFQNRARGGSNYLNAGSWLKQLATHEAVWRTQDTDKNGVADYWTRDVAAFHAIHDANDRAVAFIDLAFALADRAPGMAYPELRGVAAPRQGYWFRAMVEDQDRAPYIDYRQPVPRAMNCPGGQCTNAWRFGFTAWPKVTDEAGGLHFMIAEDGVVWQKGIEGEPVLRRALAAPPGADAMWSQFGG